MDRIMAMPRAKELAEEPEMPSVAELRKRLGGNLSDEEFLLRATMPGELIDAMQAAGPAPRHYEPEAQRVMKLVRTLLARTDLAQIAVQKDGFRLDLKRSGASPARRPEPVEA
jgi:oxaloacetate decarboxylase alpha subunit